MDQQVTHDWKVGDKVEWMHSSTRGRSITVFRCKGFVHKIDGEMVCCRRGKSGKVDYWFEIDLLGEKGSGRIGASGPLKDFVLKMFGKRG